MTPEIPAGFVKLCATRDLPFSGGKRFIVGDHDIAVFNLNGEFRAFGNVCPHQHAAILCDGFIEDESVVCPAHGWKFSLEDGKRDGTRRGIDRYPLKIIGKDVYIELPEEQPKFGLW